jgi:hypothetical protein
LKPGNAKMGFDMLMSVLHEREPKTVDCDKADHSRQSSLQSRLKRTPVAANAVRQAARAEALCLKSGKNTAD